MNYGTLETELATRLNTYFEANNVDDKFEAMPIPDKQADQLKAFEKGKVYVQYFTSTYKPSQSINETSQHEEVTIRVTFETTDFRGEKGAFNLLERTKLCLFGYKPQNCTKRLTIEKYDLVSFENNGVSPYLDFKTETLNVMVPDAGDEEPLFKDLTIQSQCPT